MELASQYEIKKETKNASLHSLLMTVIMVTKKGVYSRNGLELFFEKYLTATGCPPLTLKCFERTKAKKITQASLDTDSKAALIREFAHATSLNAPHEITQSCTYQGVCSRNIPERSALKE